MDKERFNQLLTNAKLSKKEFAEKVEMTYGAVNNWGSSQQFPRWVESWLDNYIKAKLGEDVINAVKPLIKCEDK